MEDFFEISKAKNKNYKKGRPPQKKNPQKTKTPKHPPPPRKKNLFAIFQNPNPSEKGVAKCPKLYLMFIYLISCNCLINSIPLFVNLTKNVCWQKRGLPSSVSAHLMIRAFCW